MQERKRLDVTVVYLHQAFISFVVLYKRGFVMFGVVSLTMGNSPLPLRDGGLGDVQRLGELPLGQAQRSPAIADVLAEGLFTLHRMAPFLCDILSFAGLASPPLLYAIGDKKSRMRGRFGPRLSGKSSICRPLRGCTGAPDALASGAAAFIAALHRQLELEPGVGPLVDDGPGVAVGLALRPGEVAEVKFHVQVAGNDVQDDLPDLLEPLRDAGHVGEDDADVAEPVLLLGQGLDAAAGDGVVDVREGEAVPADAQQGGDGLAAQVGGVVDRGTGEEGLPPVQAPAGGLQAPVGPGVQPAAGGQRLQGGLSSAAHQRLPLSLRPVKIST